MSLSFPGEAGGPRNRGCAAGWSLLAAAVVAGCTAPAGAPSTLPAPPGGGAAGLVGESSAALRAQFGPPLLLRRDGPAEVWLYRSASCTVDLILYPDPGTGLQRVSVADVLPAGAPSSTGECLAGLGGVPGRSTGQIAAGGP